MVFCFYFPERLNFLGPRLKGGVQLVNVNQLLQWSIEDGVSISEVISINGYYETFMKHNFQ